MIENDTLSAFSASSHRHEAKELDRSHRSAAFGLFRHGLLAGVTTVPSAVFAAGALPAIQL